MFDSSVKKSFLYNITFYPQECYIYFINNKLETDIQNKINGFLVLVRNEIEKNGRILEQECSFNYIEYEMYLTSVVDCDVENKLNKPKHIQSGPKVTIYHVWPTLYGNIS